MLENIILGLQNAVLNPVNFLIMPFGVLAGMVFGALPGFSATMAVAVLVPVTYWMAPEAGLLLLSAIFCGSIYGGSIPAILLRIPGTPASVPTTFDGFALTQKGQAARALGISTLSSAFGGIVSGFALLFFAPILAEFSLRFGPPEIMCLAILGLSVVSMLSPGNLCKGLIACVIGLLIAIVGMDPVGGYPRLTFGSIFLLSGIPLVPVLIGLFSIPPVLEMAEKGLKGVDVPKVTGSLIAKWQDVKKVAGTLIRSALIGVGIGIIPAAGPEVASFVGYNDAQRRSKNRENFGKGEIDGVAAPECAHSSCTGGSLIPLFTLGIPGSAPAAIFLGALFIHGLRPGPMIFVQRPEIGYTVMVGFVLLNIMLYFLGVMFCRVTSRAVRVPQNILAPVVVVLTILGAYAIGSTMVDVWVMIGSGILGWALTRFGFPLSPICLALILGPMLESQAELSLIMYEGNLLLIFTRPIAAVLMIFALLMFFWPWLEKFYRKRRQNKSEARAAGN